MPPRGAEFYAPSIKQPESVTTNTNNPQRMTCPWAPTARPVVMLYPPHTEADTLSDGAAEESLSCPIPADVADKFLLRAPLLTTVQVALLTHKANRLNTSLFADERLPP